MIMENYFTDRDRFQSGSSTDENESGSDHDHEEIPQEGHQYVNMVNHVMGTPVRKREEIFQNIL